MAKPKKKPQKNQSSGGRVTPKGTQNPGQGAKGLANAAKTAGGGLAGGAKDAVGSLSDQVADGMKDVAAKVGDGADAATNAAGAAKDGASSAGGAVAGAAAGAAAATTAGAAKVAGKKPTKRKVSGGRVTPKGTQNYTKKAPAAATHTNYQDLAPSPTWVPVLMFGLLIFGALLIMANYMGYIPPYNDVASATEPDTGFGSGTSNWYLLLGLGFILGGIITATKFR